MITQCLNPSCRKELHYLRDGRVIRTTRRIGTEIQVEHFWLCGECHANYDFLFPTEGQVSLAPKPRFVASATPVATPILDLRLVS